MAEKVVEVDPAVLAGLDNYKNLPAVQQPNWPDQQALEAVHRELSILPPLVFAGEVDPRAVEKTVDLISSNPASSMPYGLVV